MAEDKKENKKELTEEELKEDLMPMPSLYDETHNMFISKTLLVDSIMKYCKCDQVIAEWHFKNQFEAFLPMITPAIIIKTKDK